MIVHGNCGENMNNRWKINTDLSTKEFAVILLSLYFLLAPLEDVLTSSLGTIGKYIIVLVMALLLLPKLKFGKINLSKDMKDLSKLILYLIFLSWVSLLWAVDFDTAVERNSAYTTLPLVFIVLSICEFSEKEYRLIKKAAMVGGLLTVVYIIATQGIANALVGRMTLKDEGNDPNNLAALLLFPVTVSFSEFMNSHRWKRVYYVFIFTVLSFFTLLTGSRGGLLSIVVMNFTYLIVGGYIKKPLRLCAFGLLLAGIILIILKYLPPELTFRFLSKESYQSAMESSGQRGVIWKHIIYDIIPSMEPWGFGSGCAPIALSKFYGGYFKGIHNTYLCMVMEYGILGIPVFLLFLWKILKKLQNSKKKMEIALLVGIMCAIFFLDSYAKKYFWNVLYFAVISLQVKGEMEYVS